MALTLIVGMVCWCWWKYSQCGDKRYDKDGIGKIVRLFQFLSFQTKPATKEPRTKYLDILRQYIDNLNNNNTKEIVGSSAEIKKELYSRLTLSEDYDIFNAISSRMVAIANDEISMFHAFVLPFYLLKARVFNPHQMIMKISLSATLCTLVCLPDEGTTSLKEKASHYRLIRSSLHNPFVGISACPMLKLWEEIELPPIVNTDKNPPVLRGGVIRHFD